MSDQKRRNFLKLTGGVIGFGTVMSSSGSVAAAATREELPPLRGPFADEDWVEYRAGPGHATAIAETPDLDPDALEHESIYDGEYISDQCAIVGDTMYITGSGRVRALDAHDGSIQWSSDDLGVGGPPAAAYDRLIVSGGQENPLVALDIEDGSLEWETDLDGRTRTPTVAYETVYTVSGGSLYALDVTDGSVKWERRPDADDAEFRNIPAVSSGEVYTFEAYEEDDDELVALDAATGDRRWDDQWNYGGGPAATAERVAATHGPGRRRFRVVDSTSGDVVTEKNAIRLPALDDEVAMSILDWELRATFFDDREGWVLSNFSTSALSRPTIAGDTVFVYVGDDHHEEYRYSLLAIDKYDGEVKWTIDVPASQEGLGISVVVTGDAIYVFEQDEIHVVREADSSNEDSDDEDSDDEDSDDEDDSTDEDDSSTPEDTATPEESDDDCGCPDDSGDKDSSSDGEDTPTDEVTATDEDAVSGESSESTDEDHQAVGNGTATEETDGAGPGLGIASAVSSLGGIGYVLRRRLGDGESEQDN